MTTIDIHKPVTNTDAFEVLVDISISNFNNAQAPRINMVSGSYSSDSDYN